MNAGYRATAMSLSFRQPCPSVAIRQVALPAWRHRVVTHMSQGSPSWETERKEWASREAALLSELKAVRMQVDKLLDQQSVLLSMLTPTEQPKVHQVLEALPGPPPMTPQAIRPNEGSSSPPGVGSSFSGASTSTASKGMRGQADGNPAMIKLFEEWGVVTDQAAFQPEPKATSFISDALQQVKWDNNGRGESASSAPAAAASGSDSKRTADNVMLTSKPAVDGFPPDLVPGEDDIYWMDRLHVALLACGFGCGDEEMEVWLYGDQTREAIMAFQASEGLPETAVADKATWEALLAELPSMARDIAEDIAEGRVPTKGSYRAAASAATSTAAGTAASPSTSTSSESVGLAAHAAEVFKAVASSTETISFTFSSEAALTAAENPRGAAERSANQSKRLRGVGAGGGAQKWPILQDGDGGGEVRALQTCLDTAGYYCGEDDMRWWMFGDTTRNALLTFQDSMGLLQSGICNADTWQALLGPTAEPADLYGVVERQGGDGAMQEGDEFDDDMTEPEGRGVWLLGEQRWEKRQP